MTFSVSVDLAGLRKRLGEVVQASEEAARPAAQAGAQVFYDRVRELAPRSERAHFFYGTAAKGAPRGQKKALAYGPIQPGNLKASVYQVFSQDNSGKGYATYHVSWNEKKAPYGFMVEFGTVKAPANPFLRPARAEADKVRNAMEARYLAELRERGVIA